MTRPGSMIASAFLLLGMIGCCCPPSQQEVDRAEASAAIRQADIDLDDAVQSRDLERFKSLIADDGAFYGTTGIAVGPDAVAERWSVFFDPESGYALTWAPQTAEVSGDGTLGLTRGEWQSSQPGDDGEPVASSGWYVTTWRKNPEGRWQVAVDIGTQRHTE